MLFLLPVNLLAYLSRTLLSDDWYEFSRAALNHNQPIIMIPESRKRNHYDSHHNDQSYDQIANHHLLTLIKEGNRKEVEKKRSGESC